MKLLSKLDLSRFLESITEKKSVLMLDYDGTLSPFVKERMKAVPYPGIKERLEQLLKLENTRTVIISGRSLEDLEKLINLPGLELWGSHGLEKKQKNGKKTFFEISDNLRLGIEQGKEICKEWLITSQYEEKPFGVAVHWRGDESAKKLALKQIEPLWERLITYYELEIHYFDGGFELRPKSRNKGDVVREVINETPDGIPIAYLGDDATDEDAFAALGDRGLKVLVRNELRSTQADLQIIPPKELLDFLDQWVQISKQVTHERKR